MGKETKATHRHGFMSRLLLVEHSLQDPFGRRLEERGHIRPQEFEKAELDIATWIVVPCSAKTDKLRFIGISEPEFRSFVEAVDDVIKVLQKVRLLEVI